ncbi:hypothetical protein, partial [Methylicorpusculum sp.]|uniref:hypothetical protein n=1 Tax=Methylicorpusculum sp. TaxID=2713644 RepID=UPI002AB8AD73
DVGFQKILMNEFNENTRQINKEMSRLLSPFPAPSGPEETLIDVEIRGVYRSDDQLRIEALLGNISSRHELAIVRSESVISGFSKVQYDLIAFNASIRDRIKEAYSVEMLYAINKTLGLMAHRSLRDLLKFAQFETYEIETTINTLGLNWFEPKVFEPLKYTQYFLGVASSIDEYRADILMRQNK